VDEPVKASGRLNETTEQIPLPQARKTHCQSVLSQIISVIAFTLKEASTEQRTQMETELCHIVEKASRLSGACSLQNPSLRYAFLSEFPGWTFKRNDAYFRSHRLLKLEEETEEANEETDNEASKYVGQPIDLIVTPAIVRNGTASGENYDKQKIVYRGTSWIVKSKTRGAAKTTAPGSTSNIPAIDPSQTAAGQPRTAELTNASAPDTTAAMKLSPKGSRQKAPQSSSNELRDSKASSHISSGKDTLPATSKASGNSVEIHRDQESDTKIPTGEHLPTKRTRSQFGPGPEASVRSQEADGEGSLPKDEVKNQAQQAAKPPARVDESLPGNKRRRAKKSNWQQKAQAAEQTAQARDSNVRTAGRKRKSPETVGSRDMKQRDVVDLTDDPEETASSQRAGISKRQVG
jgi:hypothetical protein